MSCNWADEVLQHSFNIFRLSRRVLHTFFILRILIWIRIESITLPSQICRRGKLMAKNICFIRQWALQSFHLKCFCFKSQVEHHVLLLIHVDSDDTFVCVCVSNSIFNLWPSSGDCYQASYFTVYVWINLLFTLRTTYNSSQAFLCVVSSGINWIYVRNVNVLSDTHTWLSIIIINWHLCI